MRVFIDTNVFLDLLCKREGFFADSLSVFDLAVDGRIELLISDLSIANIKYITRKDFSVDKFYEVISVFPAFVHYSSCRRNSRGRSSCIES